MRKAYPSDISREQFEHIRSLLGTVDHSMNKPLSLSGGSEKHKRNAP